MQKITYFLFFFFFPSEGTDLVLEGRHNADIGWISELRMKGNAWVWPESYPFCCKNKNFSPFQEIENFQIYLITLLLFNSWLTYNIVDLVQIHNNNLFYVEKLLSLFIGVA